MKNERREQRICVLQNQIGRLERRITTLHKQSDRLTRWRLVTFVIIFVIGAVVLLTWGALPWAISVLIFLLPFILTVRWHRQVESSIVGHSLMRDLKKTHLARLTLDWEKIPVDQLVQIDSDHPFAYDLDLVGDRSLSRLLDVSITQEGGYRLRDWLLETEPDPTRTELRQTYVCELIDLPSFRDRVVLNAVMSTDSDRSESRTRGKRNRGSAHPFEKWSGQRLLDWLDTRIETATLRRVLIILLLFVPVNLLLFFGYLADLLPPYWIATWFVYAVILLSQSRKVEPLFRDAAFIHDTLRQLAAVFDTAEKRSFTSKPGLQQLLRPLRESSQRPSQQLRRANRLLVAVGLRINPVMAILLNAVFPWDIYFGYRMEIFKRDLEDFLPGWLDLWYELEALFGLANFAYLNPGSPFAELISPPPTVSTAGNGEGVMGNMVSPFRAANLSHPLIAAEERVGNDFEVDYLGSMTIITGSNMAGKSSFLRTLGVNICLALAGAPVLADSLELLPFRVATSITVTDSVTDGFSFFYAEVRRLKALLEELNRPHSYPLFFLVDEIFRGTNNRERLIGSRSYVKALLGGNGTGVIATHDLELVKLATANSGIRNAHFRDSVQGELMVFDYKLHQGPCPTTNALRIMELAGLPVDKQEREDESSL